MPAYQFLLLLFPAVAFVFLAFFAVGDIVSMLGLSSVGMAPYAFSIIFFAVAALFTAAALGGAATA